MEVKTNGRLRPLVCFYDLTEKQQSEFDYLDLEEKGSFRFFKYKGTIYDAFDFAQTDRSSSLFGSWDGNKPDSFYSGVVIAFVDDMIIAGTYIN